MLERHWGTAWPYSIHGLRPTAAVAAKLLGMEGAALEDAKLVAATGADGVIG